MSRTRLHVAFVGVVIATAAMIAMAGPDAVLFLAVVFLGFVLLYLSGLALASAPAESGTRQKPRRARQKPRNERERVRSERPAPVQRASAPRARDIPVAAGLRSPPEAPDGAADTGGDGPSVPGEGGEVGGAQGAPQVALEPGGAAAGPDPEAHRPDGRTAEESRWLDAQLSGDVDDIAFLPPYASDSADPPEAGDEDDPQDWLPAGFPGTDPQAGAEAPEAVETYRNVPIPRHFALGTVAIIRDLMEPAQVAHVLLEQRRQPKQQFGTLAVEMGFLTPEQLRELLVAQQEGLFTDEEIHSARSRLRAFRAAEAPPS